MSKIRYIRSLGISGIILWPHEIAHWLIVRTWTDEVKISPVPRKDWSHRFQLAGAQVKGPIPGWVPVNAVRLAAIAPVILWSILAVISASVLLLEFMSVPYLFLLAFFLISGALSADDVSTFFNAKRTKDLGGFGAEYSDLDFWIYPIWLGFLLIWSILTFLIFTYLAVHICLACA